MPTQIPTLLLLNRLLKNHFGTVATQHCKRSGTASEQPAGWSKRPSSLAPASEEARRRTLFRYVEPPSAARTKLADPSAMLRAYFFNILLRRSKVGIWVGMDREKTWVR